MNVDNGEYDLQLCTFTATTSAITDLSSKVTYIKKGGAGSNENLATVENESTSSQAYVAGQHLVYDDVYCEVIESIAENDAFVVYPAAGANIKPAKVGEEITAINQNLTQILNPKYVEVTGNGVKTYAQLFNELYALVDLTKITNYSYLVATIQSGNRQLYRLKSITSANTLNYEASMIASGKLCVDVLEIDADSNYSRKIEGQNITYFTTTVVPNGEKYRLYYA